MIVNAERGTVCRRLDQRTANHEIQLVCKVLAPLELVARQRVCCIASEAAKRLDDTRVKIQSVALDAVVGRETHALVPIVVTALEHKADAGSGASPGGSGPSSSVGSSDASAGSVSGVNSFGAR